MTAEDLGERLIGRVAARAADRPVTLVGVTGGVAAGKSTLSRSIADGLEARGLPVQIVATDGFLKPNAVLEAAGLGMKKGFPETYDTDALPVTPRPGIWPACTGSSPPTRRASSQSWTRPSATPCSRRRGRT